MVEFEQYEDMMDFSKEIITGSGISIHEYLTAGEERKKELDVILRQSPAYQNPSEDLKQFLAEEEKYRARMKKSISSGIVKRSIDALYGEEKI